MSLDKVFHVRKIKRLDIVPSRRARWDPTRRTCQMFEAMVVKRKSLMRVANIFNQMFLGFKLEIVRPWVLCVIGYGHEDLKRYLPLVEVKALKKL